MVTTERADDLFDRPYLEAKLIELSGETAKIGRDLWRIGRIGTGGQSVAGQPSVCQGSKRNMVSGCRVTEPLTDRGASPAKGAVAHACPESSRGASACSGEVIEQPLRVVQDDLGLEETECVSRRLPSLEKTLPPGKIRRRRNAALPERGPRRVRFPTALAVDGPPRRAH